MNQHEVDPAADQAQHIDLAPGISFGVGSPSAPIGTPPGGQFRSLFKGLSSFGRGPTSVLMHILEPVWPPRIVLSPVPVIGLERPLRETGVPEGRRRGHHRSRRAAFRPAHAASASSAVHAGARAQRTVRLLDHPRQPGCPRFGMHSEDRPFWTRLRKKTR